MANVDRHAKDSSLSVRNDGDSGVSDSSGGVSADVVEEVGESVSEASILDHWGSTGTVPLARMNVADRKRARKARDQVRREMASNAASAYQELVDKALKGYELFYDLPVGTSTTQQAENTSTGLIGWAKCGESDEAKAKRDPHSRTTTITARLADCSLVDDVVFPRL